MRARQDPDFGGDVPDFLELPAVDARFFRNNEFPHLVVFGVVDDGFYLLGGDVASFNCEFSNRYSDFFILSEYLFTSLFTNDL